MLMTQQQLSQARCSTPGCDHADHPMLFLHSWCHPEAGVDACYHITTGILQITCNECGGYICDVLVAPAAVQ